MDELRRNYHHELERVRTDLAALAGRVAEIIPRATAVLLDSDLDAAEAIIDGDAEIDAISVEIEERCIQILALQAPVAGELRMVIALLKAVADVERGADLAANICKVARRIYGRELDPKLRGLIAQMGEQARALYLAAIEALRENDSAKAAAVVDMDALLDSLQKQFVQSLIESQASTTADMQVAVQLAMASRFYERLGDHAVHIAERVRYVVTGAVPDHRSPERPADTEETVGP